LVTGELLLERSGDSYFTEKRRGACVAYRGILLIPPIRYATPDTPSVPDTIPIRIRYARYDETVEFTTKEDAPNDPQWTLRCIGKAGHLIEVARKSPVIQHQ